jgi:hypothetical protein
MSAYTDVSRRVVDLRFFFADDDLAWEEVLT